MTNDKRKEVRAATEIRVEYRTVGSFLSDYVVNISRGGMFVHTENPMKVGTVVRLVFALPGMPYPFDLNGEVKWVQERPSADNPLPGMGIAFEHVAVSIQKRIEAYVKKHAEEVPKSLQPGPGEEPRITFKPLSGSSKSRQQPTEFRSGVGPLKPRH